MLLHARVRALALTAAVMAASTACLPSFSVPTPGQPGGQDKPATTSAAAAVRIGKAIRGDLNGTLSFTADLQAKGEIAIIPRVTAPLAKLNVDVGSRVRTGDTLAELDRSDLETRVLEAQAAQSTAEAKLAQLKADPRPEVLAQAEANLRAAQARLAAVQNSRNGTSLDALQKRLDDARARVNQLQAQQQPDPKIIAQADNDVTQARNKLSQLQGDPARQNDRAALTAAQNDVQRAEAAAQAARAPRNVPSADLDQARTDAADAEQALLLARLSITAFDADQARALVDAADAQVKLVSSPPSQEEIHAAETAAEQAFAVAELARARLKDTTIVAPADGVVTKVNGTVGSVVGPTGAILTLIPPDFQAVVQVDDAQAPRVQAGQSVGISVDSFPNESFAGTVKAVAPILDPRTRTIAVKVDVSDPQGKLRPGTFVQLDIKTGQRTDTLMVPKEAVIRVPGIDPSAPAQTVVYQVIDNHVKRLRVQLGAADGKNVEIVQGLPEGVDVVLNPRPDMLDGELLPTN